MYRNGVAYAQFVATDLAYKVMLNLVPIGQDQTLDVTKTIEQSPVWSRYAEESIVDTTNVAATTNYYPSSTGIMFD